MLLPAKIEVDGTTELLRCPDLANGWSVADIRVGYCPDIWCLPNEFGCLHQEWERRHPSERSDPKVALRSVRTDSDNTLVCQFQATAWREVRPLHEGYSPAESATVRCQSGGYEMLIPNIGVVHVIAATRDSQLLLLRRSDSVHYHPGSWTATYEEGLAPEDLGGDGLLQRAARRGLAEELIMEAGTTSLEAFRVMSLVLERPISNPAFVVVADLPYSSGDLQAQELSDEFGAGSLLTIPIDQAAIREILTSATEIGSCPTRWHPTARYRLLAAMAHFFGETVAAETLSRIRPR